MIKLEFKKIFINLCELFFQFKVVFVQQKSSCLKFHFCTFPSFCHVISLVYNPSSFSLNSFPSKICRICYQSFIHVFEFYLSVIKFLSIFYLFLGICTLGFRWKMRGSSLLKEFQGSLSSKRIFLELGKTAFRYHSRSCMTSAGG